MDINEEDIPTSTKQFADLLPIKRSGLAMCSSAAQPQTKAVRPQGRANSELRNVAPAEGGRPQKNIHKALTSI